MAVCLGLGGRFFFFCDDSALATFHWVARRIWMTWASDRPQYRHHYYYRRYLVLTTAAQTARFVSDANQSTHSTADVIRKRTHPRLRRWPLATKSTEPGVRIGSRSRRCLLYILAASEGTVICYYQERATTSSKNNDTNSVLGIEHKLYHMGGEGEVR